MVDFQLVEIAFSEMDISNTKAPKLHSKMPGGGASMPMCLDDSLQVCLRDFNNITSLPKQYDT